MNHDTLYFLRDAIYVVLHDIAAMKQTLVGYSGSALFSISIVTNVTTGFRQNEREAEN